MANKVLQSFSFKKPSKWISWAEITIQKTVRNIFFPPAVSIEYRQWRDRLIFQRFWLGIGLAVACLSINTAARFYELFIDPTDLLRHLERSNMMHMIEPMRQHLIWREVMSFGLIGFLILLRNSIWGRQYPAVLVVLFPWALTFIPNVIAGSLFGLHAYPDIVMFMSFAVIAPIHWRLHLVSQIVPIAFFFIFYSLIGFTTWGGFSIYSFSYTSVLLIVCGVSSFGIYLYEKSKQAELAANRRLQLCIHSITHDLRTPVMGSLMLLESMRKTTPADQPVQIPQAEMSHLIQGYDRLLGLMNTLLDNQVLSQNEFALNIQSTNLHTIIDTILQDFQPLLIKKNVQLKNQISTELPLVHVDTQQIWRVLCNLIGNAINHNPPELMITLEAMVIPKTMNRISNNVARSMLKVIVRDHGMGIPIAQQETIFEPYTRTQQSQYQPGLGLGLYICRQIVVAHGGEIGLEKCRPGTAFWFTLPICDR
jgi:signal transduction histidine kinase